MTTRLTMPVLAIGGEATGALTAFPAPYRDGSAAAGDTMPHAAAGSRS
jgi:hypothetical protein